MKSNKLEPAQYVADRLDIPLHAVWRNVREGLYSPFTVRVSPSRYKFDPDRLEEFIANGGVSQKKETPAFARAA